MVKEPVRGFYQLSKSWYASIIMKDDRDLIDSIMVGMYYPKDGTDGEFEVKWIKLGKEIVAELHVFTDAWKILPQFQDLLDWMASLEKAPFPDEFVKKLGELGMEELTRKQKES